MAETRQRWSMRLIWACVWLAGPVDALAQMRSVWQVDLTVASDYRRHGLSQLDSGVWAQAGIDYRHHSGFFVGGAITNVGYEPGRFGDTGRDSQVHAYAGFGWDLDAWDANAAMHRYRYPGSLVEYDYTELTMSGVFRERLVASLSYTDALFARWGAALDYELGLIWPLARDVELAATLGEFRARGLDDTRYTHWNVGLSKIVRRLGFDVRYYDGSLSRRLPIGEPGGQRWVLSISYAIDKSR